jgi:hypothetical protein
LIRKLIVTLVSGVHHSSSSRRRTRCQVHLDLSVERRVEWFIAVHWDA